MHAIKRRNNIRTHHSMVVRGILMCLTLIPCALQASEADPPAASTLSNEGVEFFESKIRPVLVERCYECHSADSASIGGELLLDSRAGMAAGGENGPVINASEPGDSRLLIAMRYADSDLQMPPDAPLSDQIVEDFERWLKMGAPDPREGTIATPWDAILNRAKEHWAFTTLVQPLIPQSSGHPARDDPSEIAIKKNWPRQDLDAFVLAEWQARNLTPADEIAPAGLIRRLFYDLTGLLPSYEQVTRFEENPSDEAYARLVDELLASPQFGERWARHWLDLARYGDTKGYVFEEEREYPQAYKYRDWVIDAFNRDVPFDRFLSLQIAADQLVDDDDRSDLAALGYLTLGRRFVNNKHDIIDDRIDVVFRGMMGLTLSCARCHDHKFDPVSAADYYGIYGIFASSEEKQEDDLPLRLVDRDKPHDVGVFRRGNGGDRGDQTPRRFPVFFGDKKPFQDGSGRKELAQAIASRDNPLTARVFVNRVWGHLFGEPIVATTSDFGLRSEPPTHQLLLDYLAAGFVEDNWSVKQLVRNIVLSSTYRQSSLTSGSIESNSLMRRRRMDFESMRDSILQVAGVLDQTVGGPSVKIETTPAPTRRTLYARIERQNLPGIFRTFDFASPDAHSPHRLATTVPQQALFLMNSPFLQEMATKTAARIEGQPGNVDRVQAIYRILFSRDAEPDEIALGNDFLASQDDSHDDTYLPDRWQFGYGTINDAAKITFTPFEYFINEQWQRGTTFPGEPHDYAMLRRDGGHTARDHMVIRRWTAPHDGQLRISGRLQHPAEEGDGVQGQVISDRQGILGEWSAQHDKVTTTIGPTTIEAGEVIDLAVDSRESDSHDSFQWNTKIRVRSKEKTEAGEFQLVTRNWNSKEGFRGPVVRLSRWERYVQALLLTNEFMFVD